jgi:hypothetical protein
MADDLPTDLANWLSGDFQDEFNTALALDDEVSWYC